MVGDSASSRWSVVALANGRDEFALRRALGSSASTVTVTPEAAVAFAHVVAGATLLVVDTSIRDALALLSSVRRRLDDGWSDCAVVGFSPPWEAAPDDLYGLVDAVGPYPLTAADLSLAICVAASQQHDRRQVPIAPTAGFAAALHR